MDLVFYYDVVCPWAYLASERIEAVAQRLGASLRWEPVLLGGLLRASGGPDDPNAQMSAARQAVSAADLRRWAAWVDVPLRPPAAHPRRTVDAMRLCVLAPPGPVRVAVTRALYRAYWVEGRDVADASELAELARGHGLDPDAIRADATKRALFEQTKRAAADGAFGVPTFRLGPHLVWGQDRLDRLQRRGGIAEPPPPGPVPPGPASAGTRLRFFHDFASPFSYLAAMRIDAVAAARGVQVEPRPILLGAMFRDIGTPDVPLFTMSPAKQRWVQRDLTDAAAELGIDYRFPSHFPIRTVLPLRVALVEPRTTAAIYRAAWADDRRIDTADALHEVLADAGFDADALVAAAGRPEIKAALRDNTAAAEAAGACGVPTFEITTDAGTQLLWGVDRLPLVDAILGGWDASRA